MLNSDTVPDSNLLTDDLQDGQVTGDNESVGDPDLEIL